jgi:N-acyl-D-amino-acid deacylase
MSSSPADTVIVNGNVKTMDPECPAAQAVAVVMGKVAFTGTDAEARAYIGAGTRVIDAGGRVVAPGFIDIHTHTDLRLFSDPRYRLFQNYLMQGITTVLAGNCGLGQLETGELLRRVAGIGPAVNFAALIGHGFVRGACGVGASQRLPTREQVRAMREMITQGMRDGAFGLSSGLEYDPGISAETTELIECASVAARCGGMYATHTRGEGDTLLASAEEALRIARESGARLQLSHIKSDGYCNWWKTAPLIAMIEAARAEGLPVSVDQYPYLAFGWNPSMFAPREALADGRPALLAGLADPAQRAVIKAGIADRIRRYHNGDGDRVVVFDWTDGAGRRWRGQTVKQILTSRGTESSVDAIADLLIEMLPAECEDDLLGSDISTSDDAVSQYMALDYVAICTDGFNQPWLSACHPRNYGAFPRVLGEYVREKQVISLELALRKMTVVPAQSLGLTDRGVLAPGMWADIVVFDPATIADNATFEAAAAPSGIDIVLVNGRVAVDSGSFAADRSGGAAGQVLRGPGWQASQGEQPAWS